MAISTNGNTAPHQVVVQMNDYPAREEAPWKKGLRRFGTITAMVFTSAGLISSFTDVSLLAGLGISVIGGLAIENIRVRCINSTGGE
ncbi:MAG: hypothetical protein SP1CHLAM54_15620 [Chlamydiia bacterium]|nr:hypothetical protein [Chlamydiia bacterium]MCH9616452.1 hypothetical protein [Chlamydiia bacterium]MCH9629562.1 hypothetical protein [Chlamydiia bacterium]